MEVYNNDSQQQQVETAKRFFSHNGKTLAAGVVIGIAVLIGWRIWVNQQQNHALEASASYQKLTTAMKADDAASLKAVADFVSSNKNSYGALAALDLAKIYVEQKNLSAAAQQLQQGLADSSDASLQALLNLRLARIQLEQKQPDAALKSLEQVKSDSWKAIVADVRGDALLSKGDSQGARAAWSQGINAEASPALKQMMQMKVNNLS